MRIEIAETFTGHSKVTILHSDPSTGNQSTIEFTTNQIVAVEVKDGSKVMLYGSRSHGNKIEADFRGDAWITTAHNRIEGGLSHG